MLASAEVESVFGLFENQGGAKYISSELLMKDFEDWKKPTRFFDGYSEPEYFVKQENIANYVGLRSIDAIYLPLPINFIFVGFDGSGNHGIKLSETELQRWFESMDHVLEHTRVPLHWDSKFLEKPTWDRHLPAVSAIHFNFTVHAIEMGDRVTGIFEKAINVLARRVNPKADRNSRDSVEHQVDMEGMSQIVENLIQFLKLDHSAYNIFVMNLDPKKVPKHYGYRLGLSKEEFDLILEDEPVRKNLSSPNPEKVPQLFVTEKDESPLFDSDGRPQHKFAWRRVQPHEVEVWASRYETLIEGAERLVNNRLSARKNAFVKAQQFLTGYHPRRSTVLRKSLKEGKDGGWQEECLVDTWVGHQRWMMIDLTAGPFSWGPLSGGRGQRTDISLPNVELAFQEIATTKQDHDDESVEKDLENLMEESFSFVNEDRHSELDILLAELDVYEQFFVRHCSDRKSKPYLCQELETRLMEMKIKLGEHSNDPDLEKKKVAIEALNRLHKTEALRRHLDLAHERNISHAWDSFLSHMGSTLFSSIKHVVAPTTLDGAYHFYDKISFHIFIITQETYYNKRRTPFDVAELRESLESIQIPSQKLQFSTHKLSLSEDPALALAYARALKSFMVPKSQENGTIAFVERSYLDSLILQHQLQNVYDGSVKAKRTKVDRAILEVPIFVFAISGSPVFIDEMFTAKSLTDMVIGVQLEDSKFESEFQCNGRRIISDLRNPIKALVTATLTHLGGLLPSHVTFGRSHKEVTHDWRWSVGAHPLSSTSREWQVNAFQHDGVARSYIITALEESIAKVNQGIDILAKERTHEETYKLFKRHEEKSLVVEYNQVVDMWKEIAEHVGGLDFGKATQLLRGLEAQTNEFYEKVQEVVAVLHPKKCTRKRQLRFGFASKIAFVCAPIFVGLIYAFRPKKLKPKVN